MMIHPCDKPCGNKTASGYCATTVCINPQYSNIDTAQYGQGVQKRIITNCDRIRNMSDEELAEWLDGSFRYADWCDTSKFPNGDCMEVPCLGCIIEWLRQEETE